MRISRRWLEVPLLAVFIFVDPLVFFRVLVGDDRVSVYLYVGLIATILAFSRRIWLSSGLYRSRVTWLLILYAVVSIATRVWAGQVLTYLVQHTLAVVQILLLWALVRRSFYRQRLVEAFLVAGVLHLFASLPGIPWLSDRLSQNTAYWDGEYVVGLISRRATGFFNSPGQLSLFAIGGLALGITSFQRRTVGVRQFLAAVSLILGVATLSRSFFLTCIGLLLIYGLMGGLKTKIQFVAMMAACVIAIGCSATLADYLALILERLGSIFVVDGNDRLSGETGIFEAVKVIVHDPWFGHLVAYEGKALFAWNGEMLVRPHVGVIQMAAYYGIILGLPLWLLLMRAAWSVTGYMLRSHARLQNPWVLGFIAVNILCVVEPLIETPVYFLFLFGALILRVERQRPARRCPGVTRATVLTLPSGARV